MGRVDILVNNAGVTRDGLALRMKDEVWRSVLDIDLTAAFRLARAALRRHAAPPSWSRHRRDVDRGVYRQRRPG